jgi:uncharacterized lipoprotein NlpE involved in copper resistance
MKRISFTVVALLTATIAITGCKKQEQCASGDTPEVCKGVQECFKSGTAVEVCREGERDAMKMTTSPSTTTSGAADALKYDSSKAAQKPTPKQQPKQ